MAKATRAVALCEPPTGPARSKSHGTPRNFMLENRETSPVSARETGADRRAKVRRKACMHAGEESDRGVLCAEQRVDREGSSPSGARMRSAISERGGNASRAGREEGMEKPKRARRRKPDTAKADLEPPLAVPGGQGVHREVESEGHEEKYRAVIDGGHPEDEPVGQRWGKVEPALWRRRHYSFTHRTKVFADGTVWKN